MAFDDALAARIRPLVADVSGLVEKQMFGGLAFLINGHMSVGVHRASLIVRIPLEETEAALAETGVGPFDITGRAMRGWILVAPEALKTPKALAAWVKRGVAFASALPPK